MPQAWFEGSGWFDARDIVSSSDEPYHRWAMADADLLDYDDGAQYPPPQGPACPTSRNAFCRWSSWLQRRSLARSSEPRPQSEPPREERGHTAELRAIGPIHPCLSEQGDRIVFSYQGAIWKMPRSGGTMTRLTDGAGFDVEPAWSPDGLRIAYVNSPDFSGGPLRVIRAEDGAQVALPKEVTVDGGLAFGPDGTRLLGRFRAVGRRSTLGWFNVNTGELTPVPTGALRPGRLALSHDGRRIAFSTTQDVPDEQTGTNGPEADIWTAPSDGGAPAKLTRFPARVHELCWSAGDRSLDVATDMGGAHTDLWEIPLDDPDHGARRITFGVADEDRPSTSRDGAGSSSPTTVWARPRLCSATSRPGTTKLSRPPRSTTGGRRAGSRSAWPARWVERRSWAGS